MGELVFEVVRKYVNENPQITCEELRKVFPDSWIGNFKPLIGSRQFFERKEQLDRVKLMRLPSDKEIGVTTQWQFTEGSFALFYNGVNGTLDNKYKITVIE